MAQAPRAHFDPCRSEGLFFFFFFIPRLSESWKPCPARCLETRLLPVSHPAVASGDRAGSLRLLELDLQCFRTPVEKNRKLAMEIKLPHPSRHSHTLYTLLPLMPKHGGMTWNLSMCLTDVGSFLSDLTKSCVASDVPSTVFSFMCETKQTREGDDLDRCLFHCISDTRLGKLYSLFSKIPAVLHFMVGRQH